MAGAQRASTTDLVAAIDSAGRPLAESVSRAEAHRHGIWHRSVSVFVLNSYGEVLVERRSETKDLFPGCYDILGGHLRPGQKYSEAACEEIHEELSLRVAIPRLQLLAEEGSVIERVVLPEQGIVNLERKAVFYLELTTSEEIEVRRLASRLRRLTPDELEARGTSGEVSQIEFWSWERLLDLARSTSGRPIASGTLSAIGTESVRQNIARICMNLRINKRREFAGRYPFLDNHDVTEGAYDSKLFELVLEKPSISAADEDVARVFYKGTAEVAGAYEMGEFRHVAEGDDLWAPKLHDPEARYVRNLLTAIGYGQTADVEHKLMQASAEVQLFVSQYLNLPLLNGQRFRDKLGNLADIAAARNAVIVWLAHNMPALLESGFLASPTGVVTRACVLAAKELVSRGTHADFPSGRTRLRDLVFISLCASATDFNNPAFQRHLKTSSANDIQVLRFLDENSVFSLSEQLGGERFFNEFYEKYVASGNSIQIAYLIGNATQALVSLLICQEILVQNEAARIYLIPKSGCPTNDLTFDDVQKELVAGAHTLFRDLARLYGERRFVIEHNGPQSHGLDPSRLSASVCRILAESDVIVAEGQAYAEIRGWKKPTYIYFRVNGRVAEAIHGVPRKSAGVVRLTPGVYHFRGFLSAVRKAATEPPSDQRSSGTAQTTADYVRAILSDNLTLVAENLFQGSRNEACRKICEEGERLGKTFAQIVTGAASAAPSALDIQRTLRSARFRVFACGGGGGFSGVTLRALRQLHLSVVAGVPSTDNGGSTGDLQEHLRDDRGFVFGVGDFAAILQDALPNRGKRALLAYRFENEQTSLISGVITRIVAEVAEPTYPENPIGAAEDFLSFVSDQLNLARIIDQRFREGRSCRFPIKGASIRNLNVIAAYELCGALGDRVRCTDETRLGAFYILQKALGLPEDLLVLPVTYDEATLYLQYERPIDRGLAEEFQIPVSALSIDRTRLYGQRHIDTFSNGGKRITAGVVTARDVEQRPSPNPEFLRRLRDAQLFVMGAGSLIGSQLSQLCIPGVVDMLVERKDMRRILVLNHVKMDETLDMSVKDQVVLIESVATENASDHVMNSLSSQKRRLRISEVFTDIVVPRTIASELEAEMLRVGWTDGSEDPDVPLVELRDKKTNEIARVFPNRYVQFLFKYPEIQEKFDITLREIEVLSYLHQPRSLYKKRTEKGRYRGALFATVDDIDYLVSHGIQRRRIHEVDSIGRNWKFVKSEGIPAIENFPGLVPEALGGIFKIALERAGSSSE